MKHGSVECEVRVGCGDMSQCPGQSSRQLVCLENVSAILGMKMKEVTNYLFEDCVSNALILSGLLHLFW